MGPDTTLHSADKPPFSRIITLDGKPSPLEGRIEATEAERTRLAEFYRISGLSFLTLDYRFDSLLSGSYRLTGELRADLTQACGLTLEPVDEMIREDVSLEFWPEHLIPERSSQEDPEDILESDPPEPIVNGRIDLGALTAEIFASAINPYPRKAGVEFDWSDPKAEAEAESLKPFAALAQLKGKG
jgi:uncharacterized metal-binding protein YceD (DUF177 family)